MNPVDRRHNHIINLNEVTPSEQSHGKRFAYKTRWLGRANGAKGIGCSWYEVPPGKCAFPKHFHCANEEALFILEGKGTLVIGKDTVEVGAGDYVTLLPGPDHAHLLTNTGSEPLRYLALSTLITTEVVGYPDSKKIGAASVFWKGDKPEIWVRQIHLEQNQAGYYDGEDEVE
jgi:uncharacterized cupin superfamily protein